jgi:hypothetical protein
MVYRAQHVGLSFHGSRAAVTLDAINASAMEPDLQATACLHGTRMIVRQGKGGSVDSTSFHIT